MEYIDFGKYNALIAGILEQAETDLKKAIKRGNYIEANFLKRWFLSDWAQALSGNNGELILRRIEKELQQNATST